MRKYLHFKGAGEGDVRGLAVRSIGQKPRSQNLAAEFLHFVAYWKERDGVEDRRSGFTWKRTASSTCGGMGGIAPGWVQT